MWIRWVSGLEEEGKQHQWFHQLDLFSESQAYESNNLLSSFDDHESSGDR